MDADTLVRLVHTFGDRAWVIHSVLALYEADNRKLIDAFESNLKLYSSIQC